MKDIHTVRMVTNLQQKIHISLKQVNALVKFAELQEMHSLT